MGRWANPGSGAPGVFFKPKEHAGELLGFKPKEFKAKVDTGFKNKEKIRNQNGEIEEVETPRLSDLVWADVEVFTGPNAGQSYEGAEISATRLVRQLRGAVGSEQGVLGRLHQTEDNGNPWELAPPSVQDVAIADGEASDDEEPPY